MLDRFPIPLAIVLVLIASARIYTTYSVFSHTSDEPAHISCGLEWLQRKSFHFETQHPPLARVAAALGPYLLGHRLPPGEVKPDTIEVSQVGLKALYQNHGYDAALTAARLGVLPFFWIACAVVFWWGRRALGSTGAVIATLLFSLQPSVLAHAGLATPDMALTAMAGAAFVASLGWVEAPTFGSASAFGGLAALALLSKLSAPAFLAAGWVAAGSVVYLLQRPSRTEVVERAGRMLKSLPVALLVAFVVVWAAYRFSFGRIPGTSLSLPFPELFSGIQTVLKHNREGHPTYFMGASSAGGIVAYFPVVLFLKTPIPFLLLTLIGAIAVFARSCRGAALPLSFAAAALAVGIAASINIGIRHILPIYIGMSIVAAAGMMRLLSLHRLRMWSAAGAALLVVAFAGNSFASHPDYVPYFNAFAGDHPEELVVDSNLDWGQDMKRLSIRLRELGVQKLHFNQYFAGDLKEEYGFPPIDVMNPFQPQPGWSAVNLTSLKIARLGLGDTYPEMRLWPDFIPPTERVGRGVWLWHFPEDAGSH